MSENYEIIICVDDEKSILEGLQQQLVRAFGEQYILEFAQSGQEALDLVEELKNDGMTVNFLITDQMMPGMSGHEVIHKMATISPLTKCILLTGYTDTQIIEKLNASNLIACLNKPWERDELIETIRSSCRAIV